MDLFFAYFVFLAALTAVAVLLRQTKAWKLLYSKKERTIRLLFTVPAGLINPLGEHTPHEIQTSAELYKRLGELGIPFTVEAAVHSIGEEIYFYLIVRESDRFKVAHLVESLWPTGYLGEAEEYDIWLRDQEEKGSLTAGYLTLTRPYAIPLKTATRGHFEPFVAILKTLSTLKTLGESAALQIIVRPASAGAMGAITKSLDSLERGIYEPAHTHEGFRITPDSLRTMREKVGTPLFSVNYRIVTAAKHAEAKRIFASISDTIAIHSKDQAQQHNELTVKMPKDQQALMRRFLATSFNPIEEIILNANELATYFHLPGRTTPVPKIKR